jgi:hypothetical protein
MTDKTRDLHEGYCKSLKKVFDKISDAEWEKEIKDNPHLSSIALSINYERRSKNGTRL